MLALHSVERRLWLDLSRHAFRRDQYMTFELGFFFFVHRHRLDDLLQPVQLLVPRS